MQVQKIILDGISKAVVTFNKTGNKVDGVNVKFTNSNVEFQNKVAKTVDEFVKSES